MANYSDIQHRFANKQAGKFGTLTAGNVSYEGRNYYSYSTIFGQWVDISKNVCVIFDGDTSVSSGKHKLWNGLFPDDVYVFPYDDGGGYYGRGWHGCNLIGEYARDDKQFDFERRCVLIDYYVGKIYAAIAAINGGKKKGLDAAAASAIGEYWPYVEQLCALYKDTTINKWCKQSKNKDYKKLAKMLKDGERNTETLTDALFGKGTFKTYWDYCERYRKAEGKRKQLEWLCDRLGIASPYETYFRGKFHMQHNMSADEIRKLTAKERLALHFRSIECEEWYEHESERSEKYRRNRDNAYTWIVGHKPSTNRWGGYDESVKTCRNMYTGKEYTMCKHINFRVYDMQQTIDFIYDEYRKSDDKEQWIADFYAKCDEIDRNVRALAILDRFGDAVYTDQPIDYSTCRVYVDNDVLREGTTEEEHELCVDFITRWNAMIADKEARARAIAIERARAEAERKAEEEYQAKVKQEQIDECMARGIEGKRDLWRKHLKRIYDIDTDDTEFYFGGNVLLRLNLNKDKVETSKDIRMPIEVAKKFFKFIKGWHDRTLVFKPIEIDTKGSGKYTISSFENDILTAGCHKIAYTEMERMYNEIINA